MSDGMEQKMETTVGFMVGVKEWKRNGNYYRV